MERQRRRVIAKAKLETGKTTPSPVVAEFRPRGDGSPPPRSTFRLMSVCRSLGIFLGRVFRRHRDTSWKRSATSEGNGDESSIKQALQGAPHHLPVLRIGRACPFGTGLRPVRLLRNASARLRAGDLAGDSLPARHSGHPPLRVRPSRNARAARRGVSLPGMRVRGLARRSSGHRYTKKG
jgi:hypothetical protein